MRSNFGIIYSFSLSLSLVHLLSSYQINSMLLESTLLLALVSKGKTFSHYIRIIFPNFQFEH